MIKYKRWVMYQARSNYAKVRGNGRFICWLGYATSVQSAHAQSPQLYKYIHINVSVYKNKLSTTHDVQSRRWSASSRHVSLPFMPSENLNRQISHIYVTTLLFFFTNFCSIKSNTPYYLYYFYYTHCNLFLLLINYFN